MGWGRLVRTLFAEEALWRSRDKEDDDHSRNHYDSENHAIEYSIGQAGAIRGALVVDDGWLADAHFFPLAPGLLATIRFTSLGLILNMALLPDPSSRGRVRLDHHDGESVCAWV